MLGSKTLALARARLLARYVGKDNLGNTYYQHRHRMDDFGRYKRWVVIAGILDPSKIPAQWHGWLHHTFENPPQDNAKSHAWQKGHLPNLSGTRYAYTPSSPQYRSTETKMPQFCQTWQPQQQAKKSATQKTKGPKP